MARHRRCSSQSSVSQGNYRSGSATKGRRDPTPTPDVRIQVATPNGSPPPRAFFNDPAHGQPLHDNPRLSILLSKLDRAARKMKNEFGTVRSGFTDRISNRVSNPIARHAPYDVSRSPPPKACGFFLEGETASPRSFRCRFDSQQQSVCSRPWLTMGPLRVVNADHAPSLSTICPTPTPTSPEHRPLSTGSAALVTSDAVIPALHDRMPVSPGDRASLPSPIPRPQARSYELPFHARLASLNMEIRSDADAAAVDPYRAPCPEEESSGALVQPESSSSLPTRSANTTPDHPYSLQPGHHVALPPSHPRPAQRKAHEDRHPAINRLTYIPYLAPFDPFGTAQPSLSSTTSPITHGNSHGTSTPCFADAKTHQQHYSKIELGPSTFSSSLGTPATTTSGNSTPDFINPDPHKQLYARIESGNPSPIPGLTPRRPQPPPQQSQPAAPEPSRTSNLSTNHLPPSQSTNSTRRIPRKPLRTDSPPTLALEPPQNPLISPDKPLPSPPTPSDPRRYTHGQVPTRARKHANVNGNDNDETTTQTSPAAAKKPAQSKTKRTPTLKSLVRAEIRRKRARASRYLDELGDAYRKGGL